jgi:nucleoside-diphosphate-sugar epimerase
MKVKKLYFIIGGSGRLGRALADEYCAEKIIVLPRLVYSGWVLSEQGQSVLDYFQQYKNYDITIFITSGLLDPRLSLEKLLSVNYWLPKNVIDGTQSYPTRVITFGSVMETLMPRGNNYLASKSKFSEHFETFDFLNNRNLHIQIHTLYGVGAPSPFMFLGQILDALQQNKPFVMTSGSQLREYHHIDDEVKAIRVFEESGHTGIVDLSHGRPVNLLEMANAIFKEFGAQGILETGVLPDSASENFNKVFEVNNILRWAKFRDTLPSITSYLKSMVTGK